MDEQAPLLMTRDTSTVLMSLYSLSSLSQSQASYGRLIFAIICYLLEHHRISGFSPQHVFQNSDAAEVVIQAFFCMKMQNLHIKCFGHPSLGAF